MFFASVLRLFYIVYGKFVGMRFRLIFLLFIAVLALSCPALAISTIEGVATVHDGDTIRIGKISIRIWGIDAVELKQTCFAGGQELPCGHMARDTLAAIIGGKSVTCVSKGKSYKRIVGTCYVDGEDVAALMARTGMAFDYARYSKRAYADDEQLAREAALGVWATTFQNPADWRRCHLKKQAQHCAS
jgi:endonuclease YncB( thermonuclease family)